MPRFYYECIDKRYRIFDRKEGGEKLLADCHDGAVAKKIVDALNASLPGVLG